jgi:6-pyruvoyltetrahydropterin/6-carboxytetrahydropterin synthase
MATPVYEVSKDFLFSASHQIRMHGGKCERLHGHNWRVRLHARASSLNRLGMVVDFADLYRIGSELCARFDHQNMNEVPPFVEVNPTAENVSRYLYEEANRALAQAEGPRVVITRVEVWENDHSLAVYREE